MIRTDVNGDQQHLPLDILCGPIAACLDRCSYNALGLTCKSIHQRLAEQDEGCVWPTVARLFLPSYARCLAFSSCGTWLVCGDMQGQVTFWNRKAGKSSTTWRPGSTNTSSNGSTDTVAGLAPTVPIGWINLLVVWKKEWVVCSNTESNKLCFYNINTEQEVTKIFPQLIRKLLVPNDRFLYVLTGLNRYAKLGDAMFVCKSIMEDGKEQPSDHLIFEQCWGFPKHVQDIVPLDTTKFICCRKEYHNQEDRRVTFTKLQLWDQATGQVQNTPILCTDEDGDDAGGHVDSDVTILAVATNTGTRATEGRILFGVAYQNGHHIWLDLWWYDWWMDNGNECWRYHGHFPLHSHSENVSIVTLVDENTWLVADTTREQFLVWRETECIRSLQANPNRFHVTTCCHASMDIMAWIAWGSTMWIRDVSSLWRDNKDGENGTGGQSQLTVRGSGEFI